MKFSLTEPKFDISIKNITWKILSSTRKTRFYISLACLGRGLFRPKLFRPRVISICGSFYPESKTWQTKTNEFQGSFFFYLFISKTKKSTVQSVIQLRTRFF